MSRHEARKIAFQMLFQMDVGKNDFAMAEHTLAESKLQGNYKKFALALARGVSEHSFELSTYLKKFTRGWKTGRLAAVDRNLIKLAMYEMQSQDTPWNIVINEAVELAKEFGTEESSAFVNGVLDQFYHKVLLEKDPAYQITDQDWRDYQQEQAVTRPEESPVKEETTEVAAPQKSPDFTEENQLIQKQGFRKIKKADISEREQIKEESVLADKQRIYGENAFLTERDLRLAAEHGEVIPEKVLRRYHQNKKEKKNTDKNHD